MKSPRCRTCREEVVWWAFCVNICLTIFKGFLGLMSGSAALVADAMHSGADVVASSVTMASVKLSSKPADERYPYGYGNVQFISSSIVGLILIVGALFLMYESVVKIMTGDIVTPSIFAVLGAAVSVITNETMYRYQSCVGKENNSPAIIANAWDNRSDALSSVAVLVGIVTAITGFPVADNLAAICVAVLVAKIGVELNIDAINGLMDSTVEADVLSSAFKAARDTPQVQYIHHLRGRNVGEDVHLDICICVDGDMKVYESDFVAEAIKNKILATVAHVSDVQVSVMPMNKSTNPARASRRKEFAAVVAN
jgi:cation diffusion facilitator family transporter